MTVRSRLPRPPRRGTKSAATWQRYYQRRADYYRGMGDALAGYSTQRCCDDEAGRYQQGADQIAQGKHPMQLTGEWQ